MSQFWATLIGVLVGGGLALVGQWGVQILAKKADRQNAWLKFQRDTTAGVQEALSDMWRCFVIANPDPPAPAAPRRRLHFPRRPPPAQPLPALPPEIPNEEACALVKASVHRTRLKDNGLAEDVRVWMTDATAAIDNRPVAIEDRAALLKRYRALTRRLGATVRDLHDPTAARDNSRGSRRWLIFKRSHGQP
jgi:hypothetical protein